jgi:hypothetical protein
MYRIMCIIFLLISNSHTLFCANTAVLGVDLSYFGGHLSLVDDQAIRGKLQLASQSNINDSFDVSGKALWQGPFTWLSPGQISIAGGTGIPRAINSTLRPWDTPLLFESKVSLQAPSSSEAGIFIEGTSLLIGIWLRWNAGQVSIHTDLGSIPGTFANGVYLRIEKAHNTISRFYRHSAAEAWTSAGSNALTGAAQAIALGHPNPVNRPVQSPPLRPHRHLELPSHRSDRRPQHHRQHQLEAGPARRHAHGDPDFDVPGRQLLVGVVRALCRPPGFDYHQPSGPLHPRGRDLACRPHGSELAGPG